MTSLLKRGLALVLFTVGLLAGLQLPGFVQQYEQRVSARLAEAELSLRGFQAVADQFHDGKLSALIEHHRRSRDASFRAEADVIYAQWKRVASLRTEQAALTAPLPKRLWHVLWNSNREILSTTAQGYSNVVPINTGAVVSGVVGGLLLLLIGLFGGVGFLALQKTVKENADKNQPLNLSTAAEPAGDNHITEQEKSG